MTRKTIYDDLGVPRVINAAGTKTRIGGTLIREEAADAMRNAARNFARISDLQARASTLIEDVTGAQAGYVTSGASAALILSAAACIAGDDPDAMRRLPETDGLPDRIVMPRTHRTGYDNALRTSGATIVDIGTNDTHLGTGSVDVEPWEIRSAIDEDTAAVAYVAKPYTEPPLETVTEIAHDSGIPVIVDAAAELPPVENLSRFVEQGADLVAFSGGKSVRGPQTTGILAGREPLIRSVAAQHLDMHAADPVWNPPTDILDTSQFDGVPRQGIGRPLKVGKEELVGLIRALKLFVEEDHDARRQEWSQRNTLITESLHSTPGFVVDITANDGKTAVPEIEVTVDDSVVGMSATELVGLLRDENPRIFVGADALDDGKFTINPMCLDDDEASYIADRIVSQVYE